MSSAPCLSPHPLPLNPSYPLLKHHRTRSKKSSTRWTTWCSCPSQKWSHPGTSWNSFVGVGVVGSDEGVVVGDEEEGVGDEGAVAEEAEPTMSASSFRGAVNWSRSPSRKSIGGIREGGAVVVSSSSPPPNSLARKCRWWPSDRTQPTPSGYEMAITAATRVLLSKDEECDMDDDEEWAQAHSVMAPYEYPHSTMSWMRTVS